MAEISTSIHRMTSSLVAKVELTDNATVRLQVRSQHGSTSTVDLTPVEAREVANALMSSAAQAADYLTEQEGTEQ